MKVSKKWLQKFFDAELPGASALADALTFHAFEIEEVEKYAEDEVLDVKVTPNRGHDCLSHRGIAKELSAILQVPLAHDPLAGNPDLSKVSDMVEVSIENLALCKRYIAGYIRGVKVGQSPKWLQKRLEAIGQKPINNIVDATNFVMFNTGQPLHAFDASKLKTKNEKLSIEVRNANAGEKITALDRKEYQLGDSMLVIGDKNSGEAIGIAGVKGGMPASIGESTEDIIIESANFDGPSVRKSAKALKLRTDASVRFEEVISPELAAYGMQNVVELIQKFAGGTLEGFVDVYLAPQEKREVSVTLAQVRQLLGPMFGEREIVDAFTRLDFHFSQTGDSFAVEIPFERLDLQIPEDLVEEVGRIIGYDHVPAAPLPPFEKKVEINPNFYAAEKAREELIEKGYSEVFTSVFAERGERVVANKIDGVRPYLRSNLTDGLKDAYEKNKRNAEFLGLKEVRIFEIGAVWKDGQETTMLGIADKSGVREEPLPIPKDIPEQYENYPLSSAEHYQPFSKYPFIIRDVAFWLPGPGYLASVGALITEFLRKHSRGLWIDIAGDLNPFDTFKKEGRMSVTFHIIFQSFDRTLTEQEVNPVIEQLYDELKGKGFEIR